MNERIQGKSVSELTEFFSAVCRKNDITLPNLDIVAEIIVDLKQFHGSVSYQDLQYAFRNWSNGIFKQLRRPRNLNAHFIGEVLREFQEFKGSGAKLEKDKPKPVKKEFTREEKHTEAVQALANGLNVFRSSIQGNKQSSIIARKLWSAWVTARDYGISLPTEPTDYWVQKVSAKDMANMNPGAWEEVIKARNTRGAIKEDPEVINKAAIMCAYYDQIGNLPTLSLYDRRN